MKKYLNLFLTFVFLSIIPLLFIGCANLIINNINNQSAKILYTIADNSMDLAHEFPDLSTDEMLDNLAQKENGISLLYNIVNTYLSPDTDTSLTELQSAVQELKILSSDLDMYSKYAWLLIVFGFVSVLFVFLLSIIARINRLFLLITFKIGFFIIGLSAAIMVLAQSLFLIGVIYYPLMYYTGYILPKLMFVIGASGVLVSGYAIYNFFKKLNKRNIIIGYTASKNEQNKIWDFVTNIAHNFNTSVPDNIILGLGDNYYVTQSNAICLSGPIKGKTLFLSLSFLNRMTEQELSAVIVHELSHFKGYDTLFSLYFYPTWKRLHDTVADFESTDSFGAMPVSVFLKNFMNLFAIEEAKVSREREKQADINGAQQTSNKTMAIALIKITYLSIFWGTVINDCVASAKEGKVIKNKNTLLNFIIEHKKNTKSDIKNIVLKESETNPMDSHPSLCTRLKYLNVDIDSVLNETKFFGIKTASALIQNKESIETDLSIAEHHIYFGKTNQ